MEKQLTDKEKFDNYAKYQKLNFLIGKSRSSAFLNLIMGSLLCITLRNQVELSIILTWFILLTLSSSVRLIVFQRFTKIAPKNHELLNWEKAHYFSILISTSTWGFGGAYFVTLVNAEFHYIIFFFLMGLSGGIIAIYSYLRLLVVLSVYSILLPTTIVFFYLGGDSHTWVAIYSSLLLLAGIKSSKALSDSLHKSLSLAFELKAEKEEVERISAAKTRFLAAASHDLRQPLQAQHFFIEALQLAKDDKKRKLLIGQLKESTHVLGELLNSLLDLSKLDANAVTTNISKININTLLFKLEAEFNSSHINSNIVFKVIPCDFWIKSDKVLLENIIRNLLSNAFRFTHSGHILLACKKTDNNVISIEVRDTGSGIAKEQFAFILDEFYQADNDSRDRSKGLGLGLSIVNRLCLLLQHTLTIDETRHLGCRFAIELPITNPPEMKVEANSINLTPLKDITALVIDDDHLVLESIDSLLDQWHCKTILADSKEQALLAIDTNKPDVIISDYRLRNKETGTQIIESIHLKLNKKIPAIILTGDTSPERLKQLDKTPYLVIHKPVKPTQLRAALNSLIH